MIRSAYLRVYVPADGMAAYPRHTAPAGGRVVAASEHFVWGEPFSDDAFATVVDGREYVCPRSAKLRMLEGVLAFSHAYPSSGLLPERTLRWAAEELEDLKSKRPRARSHILTSAWHVPLRWFLPFTVADRQIYEVGGTKTIRYRTTLGPARPRVERAGSVLDAAGFDDGIVEQVRDLWRWLDGFPGDALLELDYAGVGGLFREGDLAFDESAGEVAASIAALADFDYEAAGRHYASVVARWSHAQALAYAN